MNKRNPLLLILALVGSVFFGGLALLAKLASSEAETAKAQENEPVVVEVDRAQVDTLGTFSDSSEDTLRTVGAAYESTLQAQQELQQQVAEQLQKVNSNLQTQLSSQEQAHQDQVAVLESQVETLAARLNQALSSLDEKIADNRSTLAHNQAPINQGAYDKLGINSPRQGGEWEQEEHWNDKHTFSTSGGDTLIWTQPLDARQDKDGNWMTPAIKALTDTGRSVVSGFESTGSFTTEDKDTPVYTLHRGSVLSDAVSMTALMGRVPMNGQVTDAYPFSMIVGAKNLMANGFTLPDVQGAIVTGTVTGDWSLSCVRGVVESIDIIRTDGTILSYPQSEESIDSGFDGSNIKTAELGFLADPNGNPCLSGIRISNAPAYLASKGLLDAASAAASAASIAQQTVSVDGSTTTSALTGNALKSAAGESAAALTDTVSEFIQARMGASFDIVYVEPGVKAAIHLRKPITLSAPIEPVRVRYESHTQGVSYALP